MTTVNACSCWCFAAVNGIVILFLGLSKLTKIIITDNIFVIIFNCYVLYCISCTMYIHIFFMLYIMHFITQYLCYKYVIYLLSDTYVISYILFFMVYSVLQMFWHYTLLTQYSCIMYLHICYILLMYSLRVMHHIL